MNNLPGLRVKGRFLYDNEGNKVILYGVNRMIIWLDIDGITSYREIAKTGANVVRIVWTGQGSAEELDTTITNCWKENMIPMIENHDATGDFSKLQKCVDYWCRPDILSVIKKHEKYLLLNIANEAGDYKITDEEFRQVYEAIVLRMRDEGIHVPLVIDGTDWGKNIDILLNNGNYLLEKDPDHNLIFSIHMYWPSRKFSDQYISDKLNRSVELNLPLIVGEFGNEWDKEPGGDIPYKTIIELCHKLEIGYLPWSWGPGNNPQTWLDMTTDGSFETLHDWGLEIAVTSPHSIRNLAERPWVKNN